MATAPIKPSGTSVTEFIFVSSNMISAKAVTLGGSPVMPNRALVDVGGLAQTFDIDYSILGNSLFWNSRGLETILSVGDVIRIQYFTI